MRLLSNLPAFGVAVLVVGLMTGCALRPRSQGAASEDAASNGTNGDVPVSGEAPAACAAPAGEDRKSQVCHRWTCDRVGMTTATWSGDPQSCSAGSFDAASRARANAVVNVYRFLANVPELIDEPIWYDAAQACALLADANDALSHEPPAEWACYSDLAAQASAVSLIANRSAPHAVDPFIEDSGNEGTMVHRRWLLSDKIERLAFGSTNKFACVVVDGRNFDGPEQVKAAEERKKKSKDAFTWSAWPPSGAVPIEALQKTNVDITGWTVQSSTHSLDNATASITLDGESLPVQIVTLAPSLGSLSAVNIVPNGWTVQPERQYFVHVDSGTAVIDYTVEPTSCP